MNLESNFKIDFITVVYKRLKYAKVIHESIKKYVDYPYTYYIVNNGDNSLTSPELKQLKEMFKTVIYNNNPNVRKKITKIFESIIMFP